MMRHAEVLSTGFQEMDKDSRVWVIRMYISVRGELKSQLWRVWPTKWSNSAHKHVCSTIPVQLCPWGSWSPRFYSCVIVNRDLKKSVEIGKRCVYFGVKFLKCVHSFLTTYFPTNFLKYFHLCWCDIMRSSRTQTQWLAGTKYLQKKKN